MPVSVSENKRRAVLCIAIGSLDRTTQAGCSQRGGTRRAIVPTALQVEVELSLGGLPLVQQLPGAYQVGLCRRPPPVLTGERFGQTLEQLNEAKSQFEIGRFVKILFRLSRAVVEPPQRRHRKEGIPLSTSLPNVAQQILRIVGMVQASRVGASVFCSRRRRHETAQQDKPCDRGYD